jgi:hypothetical protein
VGTVAAGQRLVVGASLNWYRANWIPLDAPGRLNELLLDWLQLATFWSDAGDERVSAAEEHRSRLI